MVHVRLALIRHSKSCANHVRHIAGTEESDHPLIVASQTLRDPALSVVGRRMAAAYGPRLRQKLRDLGLDVERAVIGASPLRRAQQTAALLFPGFRVTTFRHLGENGAIPENTPEGTRYTSPDWRAFVASVAAHTTSGTHGDFVIIGHGSFLRSIAWQAVTGAARTKPFANLDGFLVEADIGVDGSIQDACVTPLSLPANLAPHVHNAADACALPAKIRRLTQKMTQKQQRGGGLPLAYYQDGAQMRGTYAEPTGAGLATTTAAWSRSPLSQTGGRRKSRKVHRRRQAGGWAPSVMGTFAANGATVLPIAAYLGYKMYKNQRPTRKSGGTRRRR
jgi:broad specificity phosphatase PhoE